MPALLVSCCCQAALFALSERQHEDAGCQQVKSSQDENEGVGERPRVTKSLTSPESTEGGEHDTDDELQCVFWYQLEWRSYQCAKHNDQYTSHCRTNCGRANAPDAPVVVPVATGLLPNVITIKATSNPSSKTDLYARAMPKGSNLGSMTIHARVVPPASLRI